MDWTGEKFLDRFVDPGLDIDKSWLPSDETVRQCDRLGKAVALMELVRDHPGRLAESKGREIRKADKLNAKRVQARLNNGLKQWWPKDDKNRDANMRVAIVNWKEHNDVKQQAAQLQWPQWWAEHKVVLQNLMRFVATHAKARGDVKKGNAYLNRLANEYRAIDEVLGNLQTQELE